MTDDEPEQVPLDFGPLWEDETQEVAVLTVNQLVAYNLMRARRQKGWTQMETADRLRERTGKRWTAATLSAAERSWQTGRSRQFDANELAAFAEVFEWPIPYFFIPIKPSKKDQHIWYALSRVDAAIEFPTMRTKELLDAAVPLRYPSALVDQVNALRRLDGLNWSPSASVDWFRPEEHFSPQSESDEEVSGDASTTRKPLGSARIERERPSVAVEPVNDDDNIAFRVNADTGEKEIVFEVTQQEFTDTVKRVLRELTDKVLGDFGVSSQTEVRPPQEPDMLEDE